VSAANVRNLHAYLTEERRHEGWRRFIYSSSAQILVLLLLGALCLFLFSKLLRSWFVVAILFGAGTSASGSFTSWLKRRASEEKWRMAVKDPHARAWSEQLRELAVRGTLPSRIHPIIAQHLDELAETCMSIRTLLNGDSWQDDSKAKHWREVQLNSLDAVDESMHRALMEAYPYVRRSGMRKATFAEMIEQDPSAERVVNRIKELHLKVSTLKEGLIEATGNPDLSQLDHALAELQAIRKAEAELDQVEQKA
jgi:hypothetical protein